jgi:hypothetical protein
MAMGARQACPSESWRRRAALARPSRGSWMMHQNADAPLATQSDSASLSESGSMAIPIPIPPRNHTRKIVHPDCRKSKWPIRAGPNFTCSSERLGRKFRRRHIPPSNARRVSSMLSRCESVLPPNGETAAMSGKVKRNEPCPCGSGQKYKHCCGPKKRVRPTNQRRVVPPVLLFACVAGAAAVIGFTRYQLGRSATARRPPPDPPPPGKVTPPGAPSPKTVGVPQPQPSGPVPAGKVWSPQHGHWHDVPITASGGQVSSRGSRPAKPLTPQPDGPVPEGKIWSPEHGHWHNDSARPAASRPTIATPTEITPEPETIATASAIETPESPAAPEVIALRPIVAETVAAPAIEDPEPPPVPDTLVLEPIVDAIALPSPVEAVSPPPATAAPNPVTPEAVPPPPGDTAAEVPAPEAIETPPPAAPVPYSRSPLQIP